MPLKQLLLILCLITVGLVHSQPHGVSKKVALTISPVVLPLPQLPLSLQPGFQYSTSRWSIHAEATAPLYRARDQYNTVHYTRLALEGKRYLQPKSNENFYIAVQSSYAFRSLTDTNGGRFFRHDPLDRYSYTKANINSPVFIIAAKMGTETPVSNRLFFDFFVGPGVRIIYTTYSDVAEEARVPERWFSHIGPISSYRYNKTITRLHLATGLRLGYILK